MSTTTAAATVVLYRTAGSAPLLTTLATASASGGPLHAHGPPLHGPDGSDVADTISAVAEGRGARAQIWDGDAPVDEPGIRRLVRDADAKLLVVEWQPRIVDGHLDLARQVLDDPPCDILVVRPGSLARMEEIAVAVGVGPNIPVVLAHVRRWSQAFGVPVMMVRTVEHVDQVEEARALCEQVAPGLPAEITVGRDLVNLLSEIADRTGFVALGATEDLPLDRLGVRTVGTRLARRADATLVLARRSPGSQV